MKVAWKKRKCGICGKKFNANSHNQRYCSEACRCTARRNKAYKWYQKNKENKKKKGVGRKKDADIVMSYLFQLVNNRFFVVINAGEKNIRKGFRQERNCKG